MQDYRINWEEPKSSHSSLTETQSLSVAQGLANDRFRPAAMQPGQPLRYPIMVAWQEKIFMTR